MTEHDKGDENTLREQSPSCRAGVATTDALIERLNRGYVCPPDAGPAWRAAWEYGLDMSLLEEALQMTEEERLADHQQALNRVLRFTSDDHAPTE
jgi:hypothetical protein